MLPTTKRVKREKSADQALSSLMRLCARAERSTGDAKRLMASWGVPEGERAGVLQRLIADRFIDDRRYAEMFTREKLRLSGWGAYKIKAALRQKGISHDIINEVIEPMLSDSDTKGRLTELLLRKVKSIKGTSLYDIKGKLIRFGLSRGFEMDEVHECASNIIKGLDEDFEI